MGHPLWIVDVFAVGPYTGNPLAVVLDAGDLATETMQAIAREMNLSETTFVIGSPAPDLHRVRIFTPVAEMPFAGHPTLGTAWVLRSLLGAAAPSALRLALGVGEVPVTFEAGEPGAGGELAWLVAPPIELRDACPAAELAPALGLDAADVAAKLPAQHVRAGATFTLVPLRGLDALRRCQPDPRALAALPARGLPSHVYAFCAETRDPAHDLCARLFFDANGLREDPATGSATACLGAYLLEHGVLGPGPLDLRIEQGLEIARPSLLRLRARRGAPSQPGGPREIAVGGQVLPVLQGTLV